MTEARRSKLGWYAYVYIDPRDQTPFYVGKGKAYRAWAHLKPSAPNIILRNKITQIKNAGFEPKIEILEVLTNEEACELEQALIYHYGRRDQGNGPLLNYTDGGEGSTGRKLNHTEETKARIAKTLKGRVITPEHRARISKANKGRASTFTPESIAKLRAIQASPEYRKAMSERMKTVMTPEHLAAMTEKAAKVNRGRKLTPEQCALRAERMRGRVVTDKMRKNMSEGQKRRYAKK